MNYIDLVIIGFILVGFILGYKDGLIRKVIGLFGLLLAIVAVFQFSEPFGVFLQPVFNDELQLAQIVAGLLIFFAVVLSASIIKRIVHPLDKVNKFLNQIIGGITGSIQMIFFLSAFLLLINIFNFPSEDDRKDSVTYDKVYKVIPVTVDLVLGANNDAKKFFKNYLEKRDKLPFPTDIDSLDIKVIDSLDLNLN